MTGASLHAALNDGSIHTWHLARHQRETAVPGPVNSPTAVALAEKKGVAIGGDARGILTSWDMTTGEIIRRWESKPARILGVAVTSDAKQIASCDAVGTVIL